MSNLTPLVILLLMIGVVTFLVVLLSTRASISIKWRDREVENPIARFILVILVSVVGIFGMVLGGALIALMIVLAPIWLPLHFVLKKLGRKGFIRTDDDRTFTIAIDADAFRENRQ